jgi:uncharacterized damage-inducible protein DinB
MLDEAIQVNTFLTQHCRRIVADIPDERMAEQPLPGVNHPAWILGHLTWTADAVMEMFGGEKLLPADQVPLFQRESKPVSTRNTYPSKDELLRAFEQSYQRLREKAATADATMLSRPTTNPIAKDTLPTLKEMLAMLLTAHVGIHLGQLSAWSRMTGKPYAF